MHPSSIVHSFIFSPFLFPVHLYFSSIFALFRTREFNFYLFARHGTAANEKRGKWLNGVNLVSTFCRRHRFKEISRVFLTRCNYIFRRILTVNTLVRVDRRGQREMGSVYADRKSNKFHVSNTLACAHSKSSLAKDILFPVKTHNYVMVTACFN